MAEARENADRDTPRGERGGPDARLAAQAWGLAPDARVWLGGHRRAGKRVLAELLRDSPRSADGAVDAAFVVPETLDEWVYFAAKVGRRLAPGGMCWLVLPCPGASLAGATVQAGVEPFLGAATSLGYRRVAEVPLGDAWLSVGFRRE
jgi:hypothetical protein